MAIENMNVLNTRVKLKYDTYANWLAKNPILLEGEVAIATIPAGTTVQTGNDTTMQHLPNVVIKVGQKNEQGELQPYAALPFVSALAADVYEWAKRPKAPKLSELTDIGTELKDLVGDIIGDHEEIQDTDTQYTIQAVADSTYKFELMKKNKGDEDTAFTHVCYIDLSEIDSRLDALEGKVGEKDVATQIGEALSPLTLTKQESAEGSGKVLSYIEQENGLVTAEMRDLVTADFKDGLIKQSAIIDLVDDLGKKQDNLVWADGYAYDAETNKAATVEFVNDAVAGLNGAMHFEGAIATAEEVAGGLTLEQALTNKGITDPKGGDVVLFGYDEYVYNATTQAWVALGNESIYQHKTDATKAHQEINNEIAKKQDILGFEGVYDKDTNKVVTVSAMNTAISTALDIDEASKKADGQVVLGVSQADGRISVEHGVLTSAHFVDDVVPEAAVNGLTEALAAKQDNLAFMTAPSDENKVATKAEIDTVNLAISEAIKNIDFAVAAEEGKFVTGFTVEDGKLTTNTTSSVDAKHLTQTTGDYLVFDCGSASFNI